MIFVVCRCSQPVEHEPCTLLCNCSPNFVRGNTISAISQHPSDDQPFAQGNRTILENRSHFNAELPFRMQVTALEKTSSRHPRYICTAAIRAFNYPVRPSQPHHVGNGILRL